jgi:tetratricopeptide (TPR) repeat protein
VLGKQKTKKNMKILRFLWFALIFEGYRHHHHLPSCLGVKGWNTNTEQSPQDDIQQQQQQKQQQQQQYSLTQQEQAERYTELALQYQQRADSLPKAVHNFQQAIPLYTENDDRVAALYFQLGETYYLLWQQQELEGTDPNWEQPMLEAWEQSKQLYRAFLGDDDPWISIGYAMVCIQQGIYWTQKGEPWMGYELLQEGLVQHLEPALPKLQHSSREELQILQQQRVAAWQNTATAATLLEQFDVALQALQPVLKYYDVEGDRDDEEMDYYYYYYAQALYSQADLYLQLGQYDPAKQSYQQAMEFYQQYYTGQMDAALLQQAQPVVGDEWQESIQMYQDALHEYNELLQESDDPTASSAGYEIDHGYIGDLHATLGSLYLSTNELVLAEMHFRQAIRSYTATSDDENRRYLADVHFNLAQLLFQQGEYPDSSEQRALACDLYKETVGEGINPMMAGMEDEELLMEEADILRMKTRGLPSKRTAMTDTVTTRVRDTEKVITMDLEELSQRKYNYTYTDDEL